MATARHGRYADEIRQHVSLERLERFFVREENTFLVAKELRDMCTFSVHSLIKDPPFLFLDLISCRNVFIYLSADLQKKLVPLFHFALRSGGCLLLGPSEDLAAHDDLFTQVSHEHRLFRRKEALVRAPEFPLGGLSPSRGVSATSSLKAGSLGQLPMLSQSLEKMIREEYAPPCVVVNERGEILYLAGRTSRCLQAREGAPTNNLLDQVQTGLRLELRTALAAAAKTRLPVVRRNVPVDPIDTSGDARHLCLTVRPLPGLPSDAGLYVVVLQESEVVPDVESTGETRPGRDRFLIEQLEDENRTIRADLQSFTEDLETSNEELKSTNEELLSTNEELQSANEELQSSREELQTVNDELREKMQALDIAQSDLQSHQASSKIATIFLDRSLRVVRFTPAATALFHLVEGDVGRPISDLSPRVHHPSLFADAETVLQTEQGIERHIRATDDENWFLMRILPYRIQNGSLAGVGLTFVDVTGLLRSEEAERRYGQLLKLSPDAVFVRRFDGGIETWNRGAEELYGFAIEETRGQAVHELLHTVHPCPNSEIETALRKHGRWSGDLTNQTKDGQTVVVSAKLQLVRGDDGVERVLESDRDITESKHATQALQESEQRFSAIHDNAPFAIALTKFADGTIVSANDAFLRLFECAREEILGKTSLELGIADVESQTRVSAELQQRGLVRAFECSRLTKSGARLVLSINLDRVDIGGENFVLTVIHDITEGKNAELALEGSRLGLHRLVENSLGVMRETTLDGMLQTVATAALGLTGARSAVVGHGYVGGQFVIGSSARRTGTPDCPPSKKFLIEKGGVYSELVAGAAESIRLTDAEMRADPRWWGLPDEHVPMRGLLGARVVDIRGRTNGMILVTDKEKGDFTEEDETFLRQLAAVASLASQHVEARCGLEEADKRKNEFIAMLSHELRNPLAPIRNSLYILDRAVPGSEQAQRAHRIIDRQTTHMTRLIDDLLDTTRISRGKVSLQCERLELCELVRRTVEDHRLLFTQNEVELNVQITEDRIWMKGDGARLVQVIGNLLQNASKFTGRGGKTSISVEKDLVAGVAVIRVRDSGVGIGAEMLPHLFEPFIQADRTLDRSRGGLGLGLALVKGLVELHGGTVTANSDGAETGAEFTVRLPIEREASGTGPGSASPPTEPHSRRRILIIEDNVDSAQSLREALELGGHEVTIASTGSEGIARAREFKPEVVLCDIGLVGMDGYEVARLFRAEAALKGVFLVALTGYASPDDQQRSAQAGFERHLAKPPSLEELEQLLADLPPSPRNPKG